MVQMEYIGLLNTDKSKGPVQMFIQGRGAHERYVLDRLPPWIEASLQEAHETVVRHKVMLVGEWLLCNTLNTNVGCTSKLERSIPCVALPFLQGERTMILSAGGGRQPIVIIRTNKQTMIRYRRLSYVVSH